MPKGTVVTAELSSAPEPGMLAHMAFGQGLGPDDTAPPSGASTTPSPPGGRSRWSTPCASRSTRPCSAGWTSAETAGQTDIVVDGTLGVHRATTEHVVLRSRWTDPVDPLDGLPAERLTKKVVCDVPLALESEDGTVEELAPTSLELGDTKRRIVDLVAEGFCRFSRYFTERLDFVAGAPAPPCRCTPRAWSRRR